ncbi:hypothetical protein RGRSB_1467 [cyanobacterium endosymbiont of Rhopalodia gibberula]|uniref:hypothetical protein n=1 Tax=cyanobacterium endosymbiont of Rhopalodia gibberula TaxID=1763363 RepID=UPI000DC70D2B|nr:hypothetical protein [cyanobacterium endosymbiont of Rhopalodia gibberula]BBA79894.1 hypothetical protein RGRSB_1467 [cyanobacterium endosymbiont of Rhopalodia gibberula]
MHKVIVIVNAEVNAQGAISLGSPATRTMVTALQRAILADSDSTEVDVISAASLWSNNLTYSKSNSNLIYCPLTIEIPPKFSFPVQKLYQTCQDIPGLQQWVEQNLGYKTSIRDSWLGDLWLPIVVTGKQMLYGSVIGEGAIPNSYEQPVELDRRVEKSLHSLAQELLTSLDAPPSVYLVQFRLLSNEIIFDRLWPFPAAPAIASLRYQQPNLFICHWYCLTQKPIVQVTT